MRAAYTQNFRYRLFATSVANQSMPFRHWSQLNSLSTALCAMQTFGKRAHLDVAAASKKKGRIERCIGVADGAMRQHAIVRTGNLVQSHGKHS